MQIRLLGAVDACVDGHEVTVPGLRPRSVLALLALNVGRVVSIDRIIDVVWGLDAPGTATGQVHTCVWRLRRLLGDVIDTRPSGYVLQLDPEAVDAQTFEARLTEARVAFAGGSLEHASTLLREALALWRGPALDDVPALAAEAQHWEERRLTASEDLAEAHLALGLHAEVVAELTGLVARHPLRERMHYLLMTALYRSRRTAEALELYRRLRDHLRNELGLEPMPALRELHGRILSHEPSLDPPGQVGEAAGSPRPPETRYTNVGGVHIAYQTLGNGTRDLVFVPGLLSHLDLWWDDAVTATFLRTLASLGRLLVFDKRGAGLSDRPATVQTLEDRMEDIGAVMDAAGSRRAVLLGYSEGGPMSMLYAATHPERVAGLVLIGAAARWSPAPDYPCGKGSDAMFAALEHIGEREWGLGNSIEWYAPSLAHSARAREVVGRRERMSVSPHGFLQSLQMVRNIDVRAVLPSLGVPVLLMQRLGDRVTPPCHGRYLAARLPTARYVEQPGDHIVWLGDTQPFFTAVQSFLAATDSAAPVERVLVTVLATEAVTEEADGADSPLRGDATALDATSAVARGGGRVIDSGHPLSIATFRGPGSAIKCAQALQAQASAEGARLRTGIHVGEADLAGRPTRVAYALTEQVMRLCEPGEVLVSRTVKDLMVGSQVRFTKHADAAGEPPPQAAEDWAVYVIS